MDDTIIIGAGINGLLLGALLSRDGQRVTVMEKSSHAGGRGIIVQRDGFTLDYGIHLTRFGPESALAKILSWLGMPVDFHKLGNSIAALPGGETVLFPTSPGGIFKSGLFSWKERFRIIPFLLKIKKGNYDALMDTPLNAWMEANHIGGGIRKYFELLSASIMVCPFPDKTSAGEMFRNIRKVLKTGHSAEYPAGGWEPIHRITMDAIQKNGTIRFNSPVERIIVDKGRAEGVIAGGKRYPAKNVVINIPVQAMTALFPKGRLPDRYASSCRNLEPTGGVFADIALNRKISDIDGLIYTYDPHTFGMFTSNIEPSVAPRSKQLLTVFYPTNSADMKAAAIVRKRKEELWTAIHRIFPDIEKDILWKRETALSMVDGVQVNVDQTLDKRPGTGIPGVRDLYLVGDSVAAPGAGGDVGNESVLQCYRAVTGNEIL